VSLKYSLEVKENKCQHMTAARLWLQISRCVLNFVFHNYFMKKVGVCYAGGQVSAGMP